jgi:hypothetical protein
MSDPVLIHAANAKAAGAKYHIDPAVILGILSVEGGTSPTGKPVAPADGAGPPSFGQFTYGTGKSLGITYGDSKSEVFGIARYLNQLGYQTDPRRAVAAYNGGPGNPQYSYASKVFSAATRYGSGTIKNAPPASSSSPSSGAQQTIDATQGSTLFSDKASGLKYASVWMAVVLGGLAVAGVGINRSLGGAPARTAKRAGKVAAVA